MQYFTLLKQCRHLLAICILLLSGSYARGQAMAACYQPDSARIHPPLLRLPAFATKPAVRATLVPGLLVGAGVLTIRPFHLFNVDEELREEYGEHFSRPRTQIDDQLRHVPAYATLALSVVGVQSKHHSTDQAVLFALAYTFNNTITSNLKRLTHVCRPDGTSYSSFPSQHTSAAFSAATLLHKEYGSRSVWYSVGGYGVAAATGELRLAKDKHWLSDVLAGAGVGIFSTELAYWAYPVVQRTMHTLWRPRRPATNRTVVLPFYLNGAAGATLSMMR